MIHRQSLIDDAQCFETVRTLRWPDGVSCPHCDRFDLTKQGRDDTQPERQRYLCQSCERRLDAVTDTIFAGHHQPLRGWILCLYCMGLNLSHHHMAQALDLNKDDAQQRTSQLRQGMVRKKPSPTLVECDEVSSVAGHKGKPDEVVKQGGAAGADVSRGNAAAAPSPRRSPRSSG
jgi:transposase